MLRIAVAKGRLLDSFLILLAKAGYDCDSVFQASRKLIVDIGQADLRFILAKPADVPTYVEYGAADLGVVGKDILVESDRNVAELLDLKYGLCRLVVAVPKDSGICRVQELDFNSRVTSKYPRIAEEYFNSLGIQVEIIPLAGSIELGPMVGLSEAIVDITETGRTLAENGLVIIDTIMESTARLVANGISLKTQREAIAALAGVLEEVV
ncbi:MAG: ATP phosphoribosyltransferase [Firmicutes bacterium]|jgi:ATP phosphoribosyltransferase|nr:ATP phosphoribosyltransferase [Bacillota bacterium]NLL89278.1 ATP phosphoribosyltransferase [Bacillota bacterium]HKM18156.1 ATP phosphoribosyltransferase [Limnochordia bacterium]